MVPNYDQKTKSSKGCVKQKIVFMFSSHDVCGLQGFSLRPASTVHCIYGFPLPQKPGQNPGQKSSQNSGGSDYEQEVRVGLGIFPRKKTQKN